MRRLLTLSVVVAFVLVGTTNAAISQGDKELSISGTFQTLNIVGGGSIDTVQVSGSLGYFVTDALELSLTGSWSDMDVDGAEMTGWGIGGNGKYHFMTDSTTVPYVGGQIVYQDMDVSVSGFGSASVDGYIYGPLGGVKFFVNDTTALFVEYQFQLWEGDLGDAFDDAHVVVGGISFLF